MCGMAYLVLTMVTHDAGHDDSIPMVYWAIFHRKDHHITGYTF